jgi:hypothetical protein
MRLKSCREDASPIYGARVARQRDRGEKTSVFSFILPNLSDQPVPVLIRQADIADQGVGPLRLEHLKRFSGRRHRCHAGARLRQHQGRQGAPVGAVIDDQDVQRIEPRSARYGRGRRRRDPSLSGRGRVTSLSVAG